jgi:uncharacterized protein (DUF302 family)
MAEDGLVTIASNWTVGETIDRLQAGATEAGLLVFARIDHGAGAAAVAMKLRPTELLIFGNPRGGTPLMQDQQTSGIDLPVKALAWQDENGKVWLTYNDAIWLANRHGLGAESDVAVRAIEAGIAQLAQHAAAPADIA